MIQRIQSIYLLLASACSFALFKLPFASVEATVSPSSIFENDTVFNLNDNIGLLIIYVISGLVSLAAIFLFGDRKKQILVAKAAVYANIVGILFASFVLFSDAGTGTSLSYGMGLIAVILSIILILLALKAISNDQKLVSESDRLR